MALSDHLKKAVAAAVTTATVVDAQDLNPRWTNDPADGIADPNVSLHPDFTVAPDVGTRNDLLTVHTAEPTATWFAAGGIPADTKLRSTGTAWVVWDETAVVESGEHTIVAAGDFTPEMGKTYRITGPTVRIIEPAAPTLGELDWFLVCNVLPIQSGVNIPWVGDINLPVQAAGDASADFGFQPSLWRIVFYDHIAGHWSLEAERPLSITMDPADAGTTLVDGHHYVLSNGSVNEVIYKLESRVGGRLTMRLATTSVGPIRIEQADSAATDTILDENSTVNDHFIIPVSAAGREIAVEANTALDIWNVYGLAASDARILEGIELTFRGHLSSWTNASSVTFVDGAGVDYSSLDFQVVADTVLSSNVGQKLVGLNLNPPNNSTRTVKVVYTGSQQRRGLSGVRVTFRGDAGTTSLDQAVISYLTGQPTTIAGNGIQQGEQLVPLLVGGIPLDLLTLASAETNTPARAWQPDTLYDVTDAVSFIAASGLRLDHHCIVEHTSSSGTAPTAAEVATNWQADTNPQDPDTVTTIDGDNPAAAAFAGIGTYKRDLRLIGDGSLPLLFESPDGANLGHRVWIHNDSVNDWQIGPGATNHRELGAAANDIDLFVTLPTGQTMTLESVDVDNVVYEILGGGDPYAVPAGWELIADGNGAWTANEPVTLLEGRTWQDVVNDFEEVHLSLQENNFSFYRASANHFTDDLALNGSQDIEIWTYSSGTTGYRMWIEGPRLTDTTLSVSNGGHGHTDFVMRGRRRVVAPAAPAQATSTITFNGGNAVEIIEDAAAQYAIVTVPAGQQVDTITAPAGLTVTATHPEAGGLLVISDAGTGAQDVTVTFAAIPVDIELLMSVSSSVLHNDIHAFLNGWTRTNIINEFRFIEFWVGDMKQSGNNQRNDWPIARHPVDALVPNAAGDGIVRLVETTIQDAYIMDADLFDTGLRFRSAGNDGVYVLKMWGIR